MRQVESCLVIKSEKAERSPYVAGYTRRVNAEIIERGHQARIYHFNVTIIRSSITQRVYTYIDIKPWAERERESFI